MHQQEDSSIFVKLGPMDGFVRSISESFALGWNKVGILIYFITSFLIQSYDTQCD